MTISRFFFISLLCFFSSIATASTSLFKEYNFGENYQTIEKNKGTFDCSEDFQVKALCLDNQKFLDKDVMLGFLFIDNSLISVVVISEGSAGDLTTVMSSLITKFALISMSTAGATFDISAEKQHSTKPEMLHKINTFEQQGLLNGKITYTLAERKSFKTYGLNQTDLINRANENIRTLDLILAVYENALIFSFQAPKLKIKLLKEKAKNVKIEDF